MIKPNVTAFCFQFQIGFERDVFRALVDYFKALSEPLLTVVHFELWLNIYCKCKKLDVTCSDLQHVIVEEEEGEFSLQVFVALFSKQQ